MPPVSFLIKPASSNCSLRCRYCFYHSIAETRQIKSYGVMNDEFLEILVKKALNYADHFCTFAFQGGEPTLAGKEFYKKLIQFEKKYNVKNMQINNVIQTNGILIDKDWAKFFHDNNFLVGISLDGPKDLNDLNRIDVNGKGSFNKIMQAIELFNRYGVEYNILFVINKYTARYGNKIYNFFKKKNFKYLQFIPCLDPLNEQPGNQKYSLTPDRYTYFLKTFFDLWYNDIIRGDIVSIRYFDDIIKIAAGYMPESCGMSGICICQFVIESDGGVYPCDFYVTDDWRLGNIIKDDLIKMRDSVLSKKFIELSKYIDHNCEKCKWFWLCKGGCRRNREPFLYDKPVLNYYCRSFVEFFEYTFDRVKKITSPQLDP